MKRFLGLLVFVSLLFSACAPAIPGSSRYAPIDARETNEISITAGPEWFTKAIGPTGLVSLKTRNDDLRKLVLSGERTVGTTKSTEINWFKILDIKAPTGWIVELVGQTGIRKITDTDPTNGSYSFIDSSELTWLIKVPSSTRADAYSILISVVSRDNTEKSYTGSLKVNVNKSVK
jgi:hypothetical protein